MPDKPGKLMPALYGGVIMGLISGIPFINFVNCLCCAGVMLGGFMAVFFYKKDLKETDPPLTSSDGLQLGALAGLFGAVVGLILTVIIHFAFGNVTGQAMGEMIMQLYESTGILDKMPPEAVEKMQEGFHSSALSPFLFMNFIIDPLFGLLGGLIGYSVYKPKISPPTIQPPQPM